MPTQQSYPKFRYYITDLYDGMIVGTDNGVHAASLAECPDFYVIDTVTNEWLMEDGTRQEIKVVSSRRGVDT